MFVVVVAMGYRAYITALPDNTQIIVATVLEGQQDNITNDYQGYILNNDQNAVRLKPG